MSRNKAQLLAAKKLLKLSAGRFEKIDFSKINISPKDMTRAFKNNHYVVMIFDNREMTLPCVGKFQAIQAMVQRHDDKPIQNHWREESTILPLFMMPYLS